MPEREHIENEWTSGPSIFERAPTPPPHRRVLAAAARVRLVVEDHARQVRDEIDREGEGDG